MIKGSDILHISPDELHSKYGVNIIHQTWSTMHIPDTHKMWVKSWDILGGLHILWTDQCCLRLIKEFYPDLANTYNSLMLPVQRADMVRLLFLHRYGGIYCDLDYEAFTDITEHMPEAEDIMIVSTTNPIYSTMQNSLMISRALSHPFWILCAEHIKTNMNFIKLFPSKETHLKQWNIFALHSNNLLGKVFNIFITLSLTGPCVLDKVLCMNANKNWSVHKLPITYFEGPLCKHHHMGSWNNIFTNSPGLIAIAVVILLLAITGVGSTVYIITKINKK